MGLRRAVAPAAEHVLDDVIAGSPPEDPRQRAAYDVADAYLVDPAGMTPARWAQIRTQLTADEVGEIVLQLTRYSRNKARVALGLDLDEIVRQELRY